MNEHSKKDVRRRHGFGFVRQTIRVSKALVLFAKDKMYEDVISVFLNSRLFFGLTLIIIGIFSFSSDKYCDGNTSSFYACTRPATYYYYSWWAIIAILFGVVFVTLWFIRKKK